MDRNEALSSHQEEREGDRQETHNQNRTGVISYRQPAASALLLSLLASSPPKNNRISTVEQNTRTGKMMERTNAIHYSIVTSTSRRMEGETEKERQPESIRSCFQVPFSSSKLLTDG
eukprot:CAMPEP_0170895268 /NCGR_PEP_ID=MMETSP0734-20130129/43835_1 /TAXON_ID=186038 /ORGANISM="Fragilariopsis kerguelensis, Strain L26-C5" /LENGTH=116 /DNA_ID=CAMNT_0011286761 /DNA_START=392 /DNA_END=742 /DNA_ORIENTATION=+